MDLRALPFNQLNWVSPFEKRPLCISQLLLFLFAFVRDDLSYILVSLNLGFLSSLGIYVQNVFLFLGKKNQPGFLSDKVLVSVSS